MYGLAKKTNIVLTDPILWFSLMLMPAGPPALVISGLAELAQISELEKMAIAKSLTVSDETSGSPKCYHANKFRQCTCYRQLYALALRAL